jgi:hypothetical protein
MEPHFEGPIVPIDALFGLHGLEANPDADPQPVLESADIITSVDVMSGHAFLVFGRQSLERITVGAEGELTHVLRIGLDEETDELEKLVVLVEQVKGRHDYRSDQGSWRD